MPRALTTTILAVALSLLAAVPPASGQRGYDYVDISNPFLRKIPIAVPAFKTVPPGHRRLSERGAEILAENLGFTGYFQIIDPRQYTWDPRRSGITQRDLVFTDWTRLGAELLVTGGIRVTDQIIEMELRLFDTVKGEMLVGKRYKGWIKDQQRMIRRFCNEIIHYLTGEWGFFDSKIAFVSTGTGNKEIYICDFDGENPKQVTRHKSISLTPAWSSEGEWLAYTSYARGVPEIHIRGMGGGQGTIISQKGLNTTPDWVPGKGMLAATLSHTGDQNIFLVSREGRIIRQLTENIGIDTSPSWSPDGTRFAFVSDRAGSPQIYVKDTGSGSVRRLTFQGRYNTQPSWSPKGDQIAYSSFAGSEINIQVIDTQGRSPIQLTRGARQNEAPSWSPDGSMIVFSSNREGAFRIYVMTAYGTDQRRLLTLPGEQTNPKWSPRITNN